MESKLREKRIAEGLSQVQLFFRSGVSNASISDFETGKRKPWPKARAALADALGVPEAELFGDDGKDKA